MVSSGIIQFVRGRKHWFSKELSSIEILLYFSLIFINNILFLTFSAVNSSFLHFMMLGSHQNMIGTWVL